jgi:adenylate kinase
LLIGPTGAGKTPLGKALEKRGFRGRRAVHFDFGANLREVAALKRRPAGFTAGEMRVIRDSLRTGALLEDESFPIAEKILVRFRRAHRMKRGDLLVLNGLPRHVGQARDLERSVKVIVVIQLDAPLEVIAERIRRNVDGDRTGRVDDSSAEIRRKHAAFLRRTLPLLDYYRRHGVRVVKLKVGESSTGEDIYSSLFYFGN